MMVNDVFLGVEDVSIEVNSDDKLDMCVSKVGGKPNLPDKSCIEAEDLTCNYCGRCLVLIVQIYAPVGGSEYDRSLYVMTCVGAECAERGYGWTCLRLQRKCWSNGFIGSCLTPSEKGTTAFTGKAWNDDADDWGSDDDDDDGDSVICLKSLSIQCDSVIGQHEYTPPTSKKRSDSRDKLQSQLNLAFTPFHLAVIEEPSAPSPADFQHEHKLLQEYEKRQGGSGDGSWSLESASVRDGGHESYEKALPVHGDRFFYKMQRRLSRAPSQLVRYGRDSSLPPLLLAPLPSNLQSQLVCNRCGAVRQFELQLMPTLLSRLRPTRGDVCVPSVGTVLVFSCSDNCWTPNASARQETVVVQMEPAS